MEFPMLTLISGIAMFSFFLPLVYVAARTSPEERKMRARFALLQAGGAGGLSSGSHATLLEDNEDHPTGRLATAVARVSAVLNLETLLFQAHSKQSPPAVLRLCLGCALGSMMCVGFCIHNPFFIVLGGSAASFAPLFFLRLRAKKRAAAMEKVLPTVTDLIARALRAGHSIPAAIGIVSEEVPEPARSAFGEVFQKQKFGLPMRDALMELVRGFPSEDLKVLITAILVQRETGGNLVQILDRTSDVIRERLKLQGDVRVHTAQGRMTGWILCLLPVLMLCMLMLTNPSYPKVLVDDPLGRKLLYAGVGLLLLGTFLIQQIVKRIEV